jgi:hypothetical protein
MQQDIYAAALRQYSTAELLQLFSKLEAPTIREMNGEYTASLLAQPSWLATKLGQMALNNPMGSWLCKAFRPLDTDSGRGYNSFRQRGKVVQRYPMQTMMAPSRFDGRPAFQLVYRHFHSLCGDINMVDEVRRVAPGLYLGIGTWGFTHTQRHIPYPFLLEGPQAAYRGDIGRARHSFSIGKREIPALFNS